MELHYTPTSPYSRKVRVLIRERGLQDKVTETITVPLEGEAIRAANPLGKVPALMTGGGPIFDSPVIMEYLEFVAGGAPLLPTDPVERLRNLRWQSLADGILDAAVAARFEVLFHEEGHRSAALLDRCMKAIAAALDHAETGAEHLPAAFGYAQIALGCAFGYLDFRFASLNWRSGRAKLAAQAEQLFSRQSFIDTPHPAA